MTLAIATEARPGEPALSLSKGPTAKRQPSPEGLGNRIPKMIQRRRCGTISLGAKPRDLLGTLGLQGLEQQIWGSFLNLKATLVLTNYLRPDGYTLTAAEAIYRW